MESSPDDFAGRERQLAELSRRIEERIGQLKRFGRFPDAFENTRVEIEAHQRALRDRLATAIRSGHEWQIVKAELARDYASLSDNMLAFEQQIEAEYARDGR